SRPLAKYNPDVGQRTSRIGRRPVANASDIFRHGNRSPGKVVFERDGPAFFVVELDAMDCKPRRRTLDNRGAVEGDHFQLSIGADVDEFVVGVRSHSGGTPREPGRYGRRIDRWPEVNPQQTVGRIALDAEYP